MGVKPLRKDMLFVAYSQNATSIVGSAFYFRRKKNLSRFVFKKIYDMQNRNRKKKKEHGHE